MKRFSLQTWMFLLVLAFCLAIIAIPLPYHHDSYLRAFDVKKRMLSDVNRDSAIVLLGGSSVAFGYNSPFLSEESKMQVINTGLLAGIGIKFMIEETFPFLQKGDILVFSPEYETLLCNTEGSYFTSLVYLGGMDYVKKMNGAQWRAFVQNTPNHIRSKIEYSIVKYFFPKKKSESIYRLSAFNPYGDFVPHWGKPHPPIHIENKTEKPQKPNKAFLSWLTNHLQELSEKDVHIVMLPPVLAKSAYYNKKDNIRTLDSLLRSSGFPFICPPSAMSYPDSLFYDTEYHLDSLGAAIHSEDLILLLRAHNIIHQD